MLGKTLVPIGSTTFCGMLDKSSPHPEFRGLTDTATPIQSPEVFVTPWYVIYYKWLSRQFLRIWKILSI